MSSYTIRKPGFRLLLGYPDVILLRDGEHQPVGVAHPGTSGFAADLRRLAGEVLRAGGRLTVVLPATEVWRGRVAPRNRAPRAQWRAARDRASEALGAPANSLRAVVGRTSPDGTAPAAAVRRSTLSEVRTLLESVGLRPAAIVGAGSFEGFAAPPALSGRWAPPTVGRRRAAAGAVGLASVALLMMALRPTGGPVVPAVTAAAPPAAVVVTGQAEPEPAASAEAAGGPKAAPPLRLARAAPPPPRPEAPLVPAGALAGTEKPIATLATRNVELVYPEKRVDKAPELRVAELTTPLIVVDSPLRRPTATPSATAGAVGKVIELPPPHRPRSSPSAAAADAAKAVGTAPADGRPMPRPGAPRPVVVASLSPVVPMAAAAAPAPLARPEALRVAAPKVVAPAPKVATPAPKPVAAKPVERVVRVQPAPPKAPPVRVVPVKAAAAPAKAPMPTPMRVVEAPAPTTTKRRTFADGFAMLTGGGNRASDLALIGVFAGGDGRHALIRTPSGKIQKVSAGDRVSGVQIAAIGRDTVSVNSGGRETLLRLPD